MSASIKSAFGVALLVGGVGLSAVAQDKSPISDAQVESSVIKALASAPELSTQNIQTTTVYGVVTLSGSASDEASRTKAENLVARVPGVKKVVDEMSLGDAPAGQVDNRHLQSDGNYTQEQAPPPSPEQAQNAAPEPGFTSPPAPPADSQYGAQPGPQNGPQNPNGGYPPAPNRGYPQQADGSYPPNASYPPSGTYPPNTAPYSQQPGGPYPPRRPMYRNQYPDQRAAAYGAQGGQEAGRLVTIPSGSFVRIRINQGISTDRSKPGSVFDGTVLNDIVADGAVAIPRGASVQGTVVDVKDSGVLKGRGELALQLTRVNLGGKSYPVVSDIWSQTGPDKTLRTTNSALGLGALGAVFGAVAGGGKGAAIGAGVGGAAGIASSAASPGHLIVFPETVLTFHVTQPVTVATVSEQEMTRLAYGAGPGQGVQPVMRRRVYPQPYIAPYPYPYYGPYGPYPRY